MVGKVSIFIQLLVVFLL